MKVSHFAIATVLLLATSCKVTMNQCRNGKEHGKWVVTTTNSAFKGRYKHGMEIKTWKLFMDGYLYKKERYRRTDAFTTFYFPNGRVSSRGNTKYDKTKTVLHWYYAGEWTYYNEAGKVTAIRTFKNGEMIKEIMPDEIN